MSTIPSTIKDAIDDITAIRAAAAAINRGSAPARAIAIVAERVTAPTRAVIEANEIDISYRARS